MTGALPPGVDALLRWLLPGDLAAPIAGDLLGEGRSVRRGRPRGC